MAQAGVELLPTLARFENEVLLPDLAEAIVTRCKTRDQSALRIVPFTPELRGHFYELNAAWLKRYFYLEEIDHRVLSEPETEILAHGGG